MQIELLKSVTVFKFMSKLNHVGKKLANILIEKLISCHIREVFR